MINRRGLITGLASFIAAPDLVRASSLMPVKSVIFGEELDDWTKLPTDGPLYWVRLDDGTMTFYEFEAEQIKQYLTGHE